MEISQASTRCPKHCVVFSGGPEFRQGAEGSGKHCLSGRIEAGPGSEVQIPCTVFMPVILVCLWGSGIACSKGILVTQILKCMCTHTPTVLIP